MFAPEFDYHRAESVAEAGKLLADNPGAKILAGGHSLIPILKLRLAEPPALIDIGRVAEIKGVSKRDDGLRIGALTTHAEIAASAEVKERAAALAEAAGVIGDPAVRNRGTIGGNVAHADPASDLPQVLLALGATVHLVGPDGERSLAAADFFEEVMTTAIQENEVLTYIDVPGAKAGQASAYAKFPHPASRYAVIGCAANVTVEGGKCSDAVVAVGGLTGKPTRLGAVEQALAGKELSGDNVAAAARATADALGDDVMGDVYASAEYRKAVAHVWVRQAVLAAAARAQ